MDACPQGGVQQAKDVPCRSARRDTTDIRQQAQGGAGQNQKATPGPGPARAQEADAGDKKDPLAL